MSPTAHTIAHTPLRGMGDCVIPEVVLLAIYAMIGGAGDWVGRGVRHQRRRTTQVVVARVPSSARA